MATEGGTAVAKKQPLGFASKVEPRLYQEVIFSTASAKNTLVVLPTGMGKTMIAAMLAILRLNQYPGSKAIFLAPTRPLAQQHLQTFSELLDIPESEKAQRLVLFTGNVASAKRVAQYADAQIIFSTPQGLENDLISNRIRLDDVSLLIFDEAHRAVGDYSYVFIAQRYAETALHERILALTASPGTDNEKITEVCKNLHIEEIEVRSETDKDVAPYIQELDIEWVEVSLPVEISAIRDTLQRCYESKVEAAHALGYLDTPPSQMNKSTLLAAQGALHSEMAKGNKDYELLKSISIVAEAMKVQHALELIETQGVRSLKNYLDQLQWQARTVKTKATQNLVKDPLFRAAVYKTDELISKETEHPKLKEVRRIILQHTHAKDAKIIIFTQYRDQAVAIQDSLKGIGIDSRVFVGQAKKNGNGLSQKAQKEMLAEFSSGSFPVLIATSVAEEGLDIPKVDLVLFYEPIPSAIRTVQRRGRTGRLEKGKVIILITKGTRDVGYRWVAHHKEKRMYRAIAQVKKDFLLGKNQQGPDQHASEGSAQRFSDGQRALHTYANVAGSKGKKTTTPPLKIVADHREKGSPVLKSLLNLGVELDLQQLAIGDFQLSDRVVVEYKRVSDFVDSIIDGRLLTQLRNLRRYARAVILLEGDEDIYAQRKIHPNAIRGMFSTIAISYGIPIISTKTAQESAAMLYAMARREQIVTPEFQQHAGKPVSEDDQLQYVVAAIPGIGSVLARPLLERFRTIAALAAASVDELKAVSGIGDKKARALHDFLRKEYGVQQ